MITNKCIHGLNFDTCAYCSGYMEQQELKRIQTQKALMELKDRYENSTLESHGELWTEDKYQILYDRLSNISNTRNKQGRKAIYEVALELGRSRRSIKWHFKHMFYIKDNPKAGKRLLYFKEVMGI